MRPVMFKEVLQIVPQLSSSDLNNMEKSLTQRFGNIAKKFGKGLMATLAGGGIAGIALGLVDKLLNPLKEVQEAIDKTMKHGNDIVSQAKQFNTSAGELAKLQAFGHAKGLEPDQINHLIEKFQVAVSEAAADPTKNTSVRKFVGEKDTAQAFFDFVQELQKLDKMDKNKAIQVQEEVFGAKQIGRMSEFLNADFNKLDKDFAGINTQKLTKAYEKTSNLQDLSQSLEAQRGLKDDINKASLLNENMVRLKDAQEKRKLEIENKQISSYESLANIEAASTQMLDMIKSGILTLTNLLVKVTNLSENVKKVTDSPFIRGVKKWFGGGGD
jgi:hypothetical protein